MRWVFGAFEEWFVVGGAPSVEVRLYAPTGIERTVIALAPSTDLRLPRPPTAQPLAFTAPTIPRMHPLGDEEIRRASLSAKEEDRS